MAGTWIDLPLSGGGGGSAYWENAAADFASLPTGTVDGEVRMILSTRELYYWDSGSSTWKKVPTSAIDPADIADTNSIDLTVTAGVLSADARISSNAASANYIRVELDVQGSSSVGLRAQLADALVRGLVSSANSAIIYDNATGIFTFTVANVDHAALANLLADAHTQYALLLGRSGGQTLIGGTAASDNLTLNSTANGTKGNVVISDPIQLPLRTTTQINALTPSAGLVVYNSTTDRPQIYVAGTTNAWVDLIGWGT